MALFPLFKKQEPARTEKEVLPMFNMTTREAALAKQAEDRVNRILAAADKMQDIFLATTSALASLNKVKDDLHDQLRWWSKHTASAMQEQREMLIKNGNLYGGIKRLEGEIKTSLDRIEKACKIQPSLFDKTAEKEEPVKKPTTSTRNVNAQSVMAESRALIARKLDDGVYQKEIAAFLGVGKSTLSEFIKAEGLLSEAQSE